MKRIFNMPSLFLKKWHIKKLNLNVETLKRGENELNIEIGFSILVSKKENAEDGKVIIEAVFTADKDIPFFVITYESIFEFNDSHVNVEQKNEILRKEGVCETYLKLIEYVDKFMDMSQLKKLPFPDVSEINE